MYFGNYIFITQCFLKEYCLSNWNGNDSAAFEHMMLTGYQIGSVNVTILYAENIHINIG